MSTHGIPSMTQQDQAQQLAADLNRFLEWLCNKTLPNAQGYESGIWNCPEWLSLALTEAGIVYEQAGAKGKRAAALSFQMNGATISVSHEHVRADMDYIVGDQSGTRARTQYKGTLVQIIMAKHTGDSTTWFETRWFAHPEELLRHAIHVNNYRGSGWDFPQPMWSSLAGDAQQVRDWITLAKLSL